MWGLLQWLIYLAAVLYIGQTFGLLAALVFAIVAPFIIGKIGAWFLIRRLRGDRD